MDEYATAKIIRGPDDYRCGPGIGQEVDRIWEKVAGVHIPPSVEAKIYADHCQTEPLVACVVRKGECFRAAKFSLNTDPSAIKEEIAKDIVRICKDAN